MTALIRAVHTRRDPAPLFDDPFGDRLIDPSERGALFERFLSMLAPAEQARLRAVADPAEALDRAVEANPAYGGVVVRSRWSEDRLVEAVAGGVRQYVIVGAGLDSFALRRPAAAAPLRVFEIDTAEMVALKRRRLAAAGLADDDRVYRLGADLEHDGVAAALSAPAYARGEPSFVSCLGVLPYLTAAGVRRLLASIAAHTAPGSQVVFDYLAPEAEGAAAADAELGRVQGALARGGEPWRSGLEPAALPQQLAAVGLARIEDLDGAALAACYAAGHGALRVPRRLHLCRARVEGP